jgi:outer membrane protein assembly factor BamB
METLSKITIGLVTALLPLTLYQNKAAAADPYEVGQTFHLGGAGRWDYITVDPDAKLIYVPRTTHTMVVSAETGKVVADIPGQKGNHGVVITGGRGFISDGKDGSVVVFDAKTNQVLGKVKAAEDADAIFYDPASNKVLVGCGDAGVLIPISPDIDAKAGKADAPIKLSGKPESFAMDGKGKAFVALEDKDHIAVVDTKSGKQIAKWPTKPGGAPVGVAIDREHGRLFVGCRKPQKLIVMSTEDGKVLADLPIGAGCDSARFDNGYAFASCRDGTLAVAKETSPGKFEIVETVKTPQGAKTVDVDTKTHLLYLPTAEFGGGSDQRGRPNPKPDSFMIVVVKPTGG